MKITNMEVYGFNASLRGMRNPKKSHHLSDSKQYSMTKENLQTMVRGNAYELELLNEANVENFLIGEKDMKLAQTLISAGAEHAKFLRQIHVWMDIDEPLYFWSEFDTYHFNTKNSESTMHKLLDKKTKIEKDDILFSEEDEDIIDIIVERLNNIRQEWLEAGENKDGQAQIKCLVRAKRLLPCGYEQTRTIDTNYAELRNIVLQRKNHRLKEEWQDTFCAAITQLPYAKELIFYGLEKDYKRFVGEETVC